jgi:hypothetical protein
VKTVWILRIENQNDSERSGSTVYSNELKAYEAAAEDVGICAKDELEAVEWDSEEADRLQGIIEMASRGGNIESLQEALIEYQAMDQDWGPFENHIYVETAVRG